MWATASKIHWGFFPQSALLFQATQQAKHSEFKAHTNTHNQEQNIHLSSLPVCPKMVWIQSIRWQQQCCLDFWRPCVCQGWCSQSYCKSKFLALQLIMFTSENNFKRQECTGCIARYAEQYREQKLVVVAMRSLISMLRSLFFKIYTFEYLRAYLYAWVVA